jgi:DNA gyrase subunit B
MPPQNKPDPNKYSEKNIVYLEPRQHMRLRPGMYIGGTDKRALHYLVFEILKDPISEFEKTSYNHIVVSLLPDRIISITDDGVGIPLDIAEFLGISMLELHFTKQGQRALGRPELNPKKDFSYKGLFYTWITSVMTALSSFCQVETKRDGFLWRQTYSEGLPTSTLEQIRVLETGESTGTSIRFRPDFTILEENDFDFELIAKHCEEMAYLFPQLRFTVQDKRETERETSFYYPQGLMDWVNAKSENHKPISELLYIRHTSELMTKWEHDYEVTVEVALQWFKGDAGNLCGFVNMEEPRDGGYHFDALEFALKKYLKVRNWPKLKYGLVAIIHILHPDPQFEGSFPYRLINTDVYTAVDEAIEALFVAHPEAKAAIQDHFNQS